MPKQRHSGCCVGCGQPLDHIMVDLGMSPSANYLIPVEQQNTAETFYPLIARVCGECWLVQVDQYQTSVELFSHYPYFSSYSSSWLKHAETFALQAIQDYQLSSDSLVLEVASNDGYLLQYFQQRGIPVLGIEPAANVAAAAQKLGIRTTVDFFSQALAKQLVAAGQAADLVIANNVIAHVPTINDFVAGLAVVLKPTGRLVVEFPHLLQLLQHNQFDTIYHEHFFYYSLTALQILFARHGLSVVDALPIPTHGGSLRVTAQRHDNAVPSSPRVQQILLAESDAGLTQPSGYYSLGDRIAVVRDNLVSFLQQARRTGKKVCGYGAPAKGNTLLNYCGIKPDLLPFTVDLNPAKQQALLPGTRIPVYSPDQIRAYRPDYVLVLVWNILPEVLEQLSYIRDWGGQFVTAIPQLKVWP